MLALDDELGPPRWLSSPRFRPPARDREERAVLPEAVTESIQLLPGNRIVRKSTTLLARVAQAARLERRAMGGVYICDHAGAASYSTRTRAPRRVSHAFGVPFRRSLRAPGAVPPCQAQDRAVDVQPGRVIVRRRAAVEMKPATRRCQVGYPHRPRARQRRPRCRRCHRSVADRAAGKAKRRASATASSTASGRRHDDVAIPAGEIGNEKPIVVTSERWFSPELHVVVFAKTSDPRAGETTYRLTNVKKGEPSAELFKIPADYRTRGGGRKSS